MSTTSSQTLGVYNQPTEAYTWRLEDIYPDETSWTADYNKAFILVANLKQYKGQLSKDYKFFQYTLYKQESLSRIMEKLNVYSMLAYHRDMTDEKAKARQDQVTHLVKEAVANLSFIETEIRRMDKKTLSHYMSYPEMNVYNQYITRVCDPMYDHLTTQEEELLSLSTPLYSIPQSIYEAYTYRFPKTTEYDYNKLFSNKRKERQEAIEKFYNKRTAGIHVLAETLQAQVILQSFLAEANGYDSSLQLAMHKSDQTVEDYELLINRTRDNVAPLHQWMEMRQKFLGLDKNTPLQIWDLHMPLSKAETYTNINYAQCQQLLTKAFSAYGDDYTSILKKAFDERWIFPVPEENKYKGAYTTNIYDVHPYVLSNYQGTLDGVLTLGHELGHAINFYMSNKKQGYNNSKISVYTAEITSTTNEVIILEYMLSQEKDKEKRLRLLQEYIDLIVNTVYNQVMAADFEESIYRAYETGEPINSTYLNKLWAQLQEYYYGKAFKSDNISSSGWASIPHFYSSFYVYQYATGISAGLYFGQQITEGNDEVREAYLNFLQEGSTKVPLELIKDAGVDMTDQEVYDQVFKKFNMLIKEYDKLYKQIYKK